MPAASTATVPSDVAPSRKVTEPVGEPAPGATAATVAVTVTVWPNEIGSADRATAVVVAAGDTPTVAVDDEVARSGSPRRWP